MVRMLARVLKDSSRLLASTGSLVWRILRFPIPHLDRVGLYLPSGLFVFFYGWWFLFTVLPGYSVVALAFVAVVMTVRADHFSKAERVIWICLGAILMVAEVRVLYLDRVNSEHQQSTERAEQQDRFEKSIDAFTQVLNAEKLTLQQVVETNKVSKESLENITGGNSFLVIERLWGNAIDPTGTQPMWQAYSRGTANLHSVSVSVVDLDQLQGFAKAHPNGSSLSQAQSLYTNVSIGEFAAHSARFVSIPLLGAKRDGRISLIFSALNGMWTEFYMCREIDGNMETAIRVFRGGDPKQHVVFTSISKNFPVDKNGRPLGKNGKPLW